MRVRIRGGQETRARLAALALLFAIAAAGQPRPELIVESFHSSRITRNVFSPDGQLLVTGGKDGRIRVFNAASLRLVHELRGHGSAIQSLQLNGDLAASSSADQLIRLWNYRTGQESRPLGGHLSAVNAVAFSPDGTLLASAGSDGSIRVWEVAGGRLLKTLRPGFTDSVVNLATDQKLEYNAIVFLPDGQQLAAGGTDRRITVWEWNSSRRVKTITGLTSALTALTLTPDKEWLVAGAEDGAVKLYRVDGVGTSFDVANQSLPVHSFAFSSGARHLAIGMVSSSVERLSAADGKTLRQFNGVGGDMHDVAFSPDGRTFVTGGDAYTPAVWEIGRAGGRPLFTNRRLLDFRLVEPAQEWVLPNARLSDAVAFVELAWHRLKDYRRIVDRRGTPAVMTWSAATETESVEAYAASPASAAVRWRKDAQPPVDIPTPSPSTAGVLTEDGKLLLIGDRSGQVQRYELPAGTGAAAAPARWQIANAPVERIALAPDGWLFAAAAGNRVVIADLRQEKAIARLEMAGTPLEIAFSPDNRFLMTETAAGKQLWTPQTGRLLISFLFLNEGRDWVVAAPNGLFDASAGGMRNSGWRFPDDKLGKSALELFFNEFFYPSLLKTILDGETPQISIDLAAVDRRQPEIRISLTEESAAPINAKVSIQVSEAPPAPGKALGSGARDLRLFRNGVLVKTWPGEVIRPGAGAQKMSAELALVPGANTFTSYAFNAANVKSGDATLKIAASERLRPNAVLHLLMIGISRYANPEFNLNYAVKDADAVSARLPELIGGRFSSVQVIRLSDRDATKNNILLALNILAGRPGEQPPAALASMRAAGPQDSVLIYFAGHGTAFANHFYLIPHDLGFSGPRSNLSAANLKLLLGRSVSDLELEQALLSLDVSRLALIIDACRSGQVLEGEERRRGPLNTKGLAQLAYEKGMYVLAAAQSYQAAMEAESLGHGYLTFSLLEALGQPLGDVRPQDALLSMQEWLDFGVARVPELYRDAVMQSRNLIVKRQQQEDREVQKPKVYYRRETDEIEWIIRSWQ